jgi:23S rRNA pseudouridine2605 synthase
VGLEVLRLFRPEFGGVTVARLRPGRYRDLTAEEVDALRRSAGMLKGPRPEPTFLPLPKAARRHGHGAPEPRQEREARSPKGRSPSSRGREAPKGRGKGR